MTGTKNHDGSPDAAVFNHMDTMDESRELQTDKGQTSTVKQSRKIKPDKSKNDLSMKIGICVLVLFIVLMTFLIYFVDSRKNIVAKGTYVTIADKPIEHVGNLDYNHAAERINKIADEYLESNIKFYDGEKTIKAKLKNIGVTIETDSAFQKMRDSLYGPFIYDSLEKHMDYSAQIPIIADVVIDDIKLDNFFEGSFTYMEKNPVNADLIINKTGEMEIKKDISGRTLDRQKLKTEIIEAVKESHLEVKTPALEVAADVTEKDIREVMPVKLISTFSTNYGGSDSGRKDNIRLGAAHINNTLLKPGEEFEFFKYVGPPTAVRGFKPAGIFKNGEVAIGIGGGLCQVSTTLYNAALLADLEITERSPHGLPVYYVPLGRDATVAIGYRTLRFKNNTGKYLLIKSKTTSTILTFNILGYMSEGKSIKVTSKVVAHNTADAYRVVYMDGAEVRKDFLGRSKYKSPKTASQ